MFALGAAIVVGTIALVVVRFGGWRTTDREFDRIADRVEQFGAEDSWGDGDEDVADLGVADDEEFGLSHAEFDSLVREAIRELPIEYHLALEHVSIVVTDRGAAVGSGRGRRGRAYAGSESAAVSGDHFSDRIMIFRDALLRDFGHDPERLRQQVIRTIRRGLAPRL